MKKYIISLLLLYCFELFAQDIEVKKFEPLEKDQTEVMSFRNDNNGNPCALLIVHSLKDGLEFEGWVVGDVERKNDTYWVYIANGAKHIKIKHTDFQTKDVVFGDYAVSALKGGASYSLQLVDDTKDIVNKVYRLGWNLNEMEVPSSAKTLLNMAATRGDVKAQIAMAQLSLTGKVSVGEFLNENKGLYWINKLLEKGDSTCLESMPGELMFAYACQLILNGIHYDGWNTDTLKNKSVYTKASEFEIKACLKGFKDAGNELFEDYPQSHGLPQYVKEIICCCEDSAKNKNEKAMECLGLIYEKGIGTEVKLPLAADWFNRLYEVNHSSTNLCRLYGNPKFPFDQEKMTFLQDQANKGETEAIYQLGCMYEVGRNVQKDVRKAIELFNKCDLRNDGHHSAHVGAVVHLARLYYNNGDIDKAVDLLVHGISRPNMDATYLLAVMRYGGIGSHSLVRGGKDKAISSLSSLAKQGHQEAKAFLEQINKQKE